MLWDLNRRIDYFRLALLRVLAELFAMAGFDPEKDAPKVLPRGIRSAILLILRPAESATRRLVVARAKGLEVLAYIAPAARLRSQGKSGKSRCTRFPQFRLIDPRKFYAELYPNRKLPGARRERQTEARLLFRFASFDGRPAVEEWSVPDPKLSPDDLLNAVPVCRRMQALHYALNDLPKQAQRLMREIAKRAAAKPGPAKTPPLRAGLPPGYRKKHIHEIDSILHECHCLAVREPRPPERR